MTQNLTPIPAAQPRAKPAGNAFRLPLKSCLEAVLGFFYPATCQVCHVEQGTSQTGYVCEKCRRKVRFISPPYCDRCGLPCSGEISTNFDCSNCREMNLSFTRARAAVAATGIVLDILHRYKYHRALWFEPFLTGLFARQASERLQAEGWDLIVPVPLHPLKQREREFNQAERLARRLSDETRIPMRRNCLTREVPTRSQTQLSRTQRAANVRNAFRASDREDLKGKRIVLVDDVLTTGATTNACAKALRKAGSGDVCVWTVARGL